MDREPTMDEPKLHRPWLVAVWPGMGHVGLNAGVYLLAKLGMAEFAEIKADDLFDVDAVEVEGGLIRPARLPRNRFYAWRDPKGRHDLVVFVGEAQPPLGKFPFCRRLVAFAKELGVERVFTFAAMATQMHPSHSSRVYAAATDAVNLDEMKRLELTPLEGGNIGGLNGVLLGAAGAAGLNGACLLGEMPHILAQLAFPKASLAVLEAFAILAKIDLDLRELETWAKAADDQLGDLLARVEQMRGANAPPESGGEFEAVEDEADEPLSEESQAVADDREHIETLFTLARRSRTKAFMLKQELDRLGLFKEYEDRFLDLFKKTE